MVQRQQGSVLLSKFHLGTFVTRKTWCYTVKQATLLADIGRVTSVGPLDPGVANATGLRDFIYAVYVSDLINRRFNLNEQNYVLIFARLLDLWFLMSGVIS